MSKMEPQNLIKKFLVSILLFLVLLSYTDRSDCQIVIMEPKDLALHYNQSKIEGSTASFGTPYYGERVTGKIFFFENSGCKEDSYEIKKYEEGSDLFPIVMIRRGDCHFVNKVQVAEKKGAKAVIIVDEIGSKSTAQSVKKIIMADDGWGDGVKIPSILIGELDGIPLINAIRNGNIVLVELAWDIPKDHSVQMDLWLSPAISQSSKFLREYAPYAMTLEHKLDFRPHYWVMSFPENFKEMCTDNTGHFCGLDPDWGGPTTGKQIMEETVRQICLWETTQTLDERDVNSGFYSEKWWLYIREFDINCPHGSNDPERSLGEVCSYNLMEKLKVNINQVKKCYSENFDTILAHELVNKAWSPLALMINNWRYSGPLEPETISRAVCTAFENEPLECRKLYHPSKDELMKEGVYVEEIHLQGFPLWAVIMVSILGGLVGIFLFGFIFWKCILPKIRRNMRYAIMDEVRKEVNQFERDNVAFTSDTRSTATNIVSEEHP